jgi:hypothetical protein
VLPAQERSSALENATISGGALRTFGLGAAIRARIGINKLFDGVNSGRVEVPSADVLFCSRNLFRPKNTISGTGTAGEKAIVASSASMNITSSTQTDVNLDIVVATIAGPVIGCKPAGNFSTIAGRQTASRESSIRWFSPNRGSA